MNFDIVPLFRTVGIMIACMTAVAVVFAWLWAPLLAAIVVSALAVPFLVVSFFLVFAR